MQISVVPDGSVRVRAPRATTERHIREVMRKRAAWIVKQQIYFQQYTPRTPPRQYVSGESHLYLGQQYRLQLFTAVTPRVELRDSYIHIHASDTTPSHIQAILELWYHDRAQEYFAQSLQQCWARFVMIRAAIERENNGIAPELALPSMRIKKMKTRWGSLSPKGAMTLNVDLVRAPGECIDYVIMHELCHLVHRNHSADFYYLLGYFFPDGKMIKTRLKRALM